MLAILAIIYLKGGSYVKKTLAIYRNASCVFLPALCHSIASFYNGSDITQMASCASCDTVFTDFFQYATNTLVKRGFKAIIDLITRSTRSSELTYVAFVEEHTGILAQKFVSFSSRETMHVPVYIAIYSINGEFIRLFTSKIPLGEPGKKYRVTYTQRSKIIVSDDLIFNSRW